MAVWGYISYLFWDIFFFPLHGEIFHIESKLDIFSVTLQASIAWIFIYKWVTSLLHTLLLLMINIQYCFFRVIIVVKNNYVIIPCINIFQDEYGISNIMVLLRDPGYCNNLKCRIKVEMFTSYALYCDSVTWDLVSRNKCVCAWVCKLV